MERTPENITDIIERTRLVELQADREWRQQWHEVGCYTVKDVLRVDPNEACKRNFFIIFET